MNHEDTKGTKKFETFDPELESLAQEVVDAAYSVHKALGPGLLESAYQSCLEIELRHRDIHFAAQLPLPIVYRGQTIDNAFRIDLLIGDRLVVELKAVDTLLPIHEAQLITYLKLSKRRLGAAYELQFPPDSRRYQTTRPMSFSLCPSCLRGERFSSCY